MADGADIVRPEFRGPAERPAELIADMQRLHARLSKMPEVMVMWDLDGTYRADQQYGATTSQLMAGLTSMIGAVETFVSDNPGKRLRFKDVEDEFWVVLVLAREGVDRFEAGQDILRT